LKFQISKTWQYDIILNTYLNSKNSDERNTALRTLGRAKDPELIKKTLSLPFSGDVKEQDIYLPVSGLRTHPQGIEALYDWMTKNWDELARRLPAGLSMLGTMVSICTSSFTRSGDIERIQKFFAERSTKGFDQGLAQSLDAIRAKDAWLHRDRKDVTDWVASYPIKKVKSEL
jgi:aminopeptidase 2